MAKKLSSVEYRKGLRGKIVEIAGEMFKQHGFKAVKMDVVAQKLCISKRTLYEIFPNKEEIIMETVKMNFLHDREMYEKAMRNNNDLMDVIIELFSLHINEAKTNSPLIIEELENYPRVLEFIKNHRKENKDRVYEFMEKGQKEGYFLKNINIDLVYEIVNSFLDAILQKALYKKYSPADIHYTTLMLGMRGICTQKGIEKIDNLCSKFAE